MAFTSIPILDLSLAGNPETKPAFLDDLRYALLEVGFLYLKNVGIPDELYEQVIEEGKAFFDIPIEEKYAVSLEMGIRPMPSPQTGSQRLLTNTLCLTPKTQDRDEERPVVPGLLPALG